MMKFAVRKSICLAVILLMILSMLPCAAFADSISFTDVSSSHWAKEDIDFASSMGIVNGYPSWDNSSYSFQPESSVTYEEASAMLYRALKAAGKLDETVIAEDSIAKYQDAMDSAGIAAWAREYVAYLLETGIVESSDLAAFINPSTGYGKPVPRGTIAIWTAKAMDKPLAGVYYLPYTDASSITDEEAPYVDMLYRHGIMQGSLQNDGTVAFKPDDGVKRCEFAAIANRVYKAAGNTYSLSTESYEYDLKLDGTSLRLASDAITVGSQTNYVAVSGMTNMNGGSPEVIFVGNPERRTGTVKSVVKLDSYSTVVTITTASKDVQYILNSSTVKTKTPTAKAAVTYISDGIYLIEIK